MGPGDEPLMKILATAEEVAAVEDAIAHYLDYVKEVPDTTKEGRETVILLTRLQQRLVHPPEQE